MSHNSRPGSRPLVSPSLFKRFAEQCSLDSVPDEQLSLDRMLMDASDKESPLEPDTQLKRFGQKVRAFWCCTPNASTFFL